MSAVDILSVISRNFYERTRGIVIVIIHFIGNRYHCYYAIN